MKFCTNSATSNCKRIVKEYLINSASVFLPLQYQYIWVLKKFPVAKDPDVASDPDINMWPRLRTRRVWIPSHDSVVDTVTVADW